MRIHLVVVDDRGCEVHWPEFAGLELPEVPRQGDRFELDVDGRLEEFQREDLPKKGSYRVRRVDWYLRLCVDRVYIANVILEPL